MTKSVHSESNSILFSFSETVIIPLLYLHVTYQHNKLSQSKTFLEKIWVIYMSFKNVKWAFLLWPINLYIPFFPPQKRDSTWTKKNFQDMRHNYTFEFFFLYKKLTLQSYKLLWVYGLLEIMTSIRVCNAFWAIS